MGYGVVDEERDSFVGCIDVGDVYLRTRIQGGLETGISCLWSASVKDSTAS